MLRILAVGFAVVVIFGGTIGVGVVQQGALAALKSRDLMREEESRGQTRLRLEGPFFGPWLGLIGDT